MANPIPRTPILFKKVTYAQPTTIVTAQGRIRDDDDEDDLEEEAPTTKKTKPQATPLEEMIIADNGGVFDMPHVAEIAPDRELIERQAADMAKVENAMLKGIRSPHLVAKLAGVSEALAKKYIKGVQARWQTLGGEVDIKTQRGEALTYMDYLQANIWTQIAAAQKVEASSTATPADKARAGQLIIQLNNQLLSLLTQRREVYGLTPQAIQQMLILGGGEDYEVLHRMRRTEVNKGFVVKIAEILQRKRQERAQENGTYIEAEYT